MKSRHINSYTPDERKRIMVRRLLDIVTARGGTVDATTYRNKRTVLMFGCSIGHKWSATAGSALAGSWCRQCWKKTGAGNHLRLRDGMQQAKAVATARRGTCLSESYTSSNSLMHWQCENGHEWQAALSDIKKGTWCPECGTGARERLCRYYFSIITGLPFPKCRPKWLTNSLGNRMELDGYSESIGVAFEHQGEQHYREVLHFNRRNESLARRISDDDEKRRLCGIHGVTLIEVPYFIGTENLADWIGEQIEQLNLPIAPNSAHKIKKLDYVASSELHDLRSIARQRGGNCLSTIYLGVVEKHKFQCSQGHEWEATASNIKNGTWCPACKPERIGESNRKHSLESMSLLAAERGGKFLSPKFSSVNSKYEWSCKYGHQWLATPSDIMKKTWCPECAASSRKGTIEQMREIAKTRGGECLSVAYKNSQTKLLWRCNAGHQWEARPDNVKNLKSWCPICAKERRSAP